jgi:hypothetical protein
MEAIIAWMADNSLNTLAYVSLYVASPLRAKAWIDGLAAFWPTISSAGQADKAYRRLGPRGTCLSRSISIAGRWAGSEVVVGVNRGERPTSQRSNRRLEAHAWVELQDYKVADGPTGPWTEVGRLRPTRRSLGRN